MLSVRLLALIVTLALMATGARADDLLPDMITWPDLLYSHQIDSQKIPGRKFLLLSNATINVGHGRLEIRAGTVVSDTLILTNQRIYRSDGTWWDRPAGTFEYHPDDADVHFEDWTAYRLRAITDDGGVGEVRAEGEKTSFCLLDLFVYDRSIPGFRVPGFYTTCGATVQGITPGWGDVYSLSVPGQWIDITGVPDGHYWLESEVDPDDHVLEENETNNASRIKVAIGPPPPAVPDRYEENDSIAEVNGREEGGTDSPNLGLVNAHLEINDLSMEDSADYFKFRLNNTAGPGDYVRIDSPYGEGDIDLTLFDADGRFIGARAGVFNFEQISLNGRPAGDYYVLVWPFRGQNPGFRLTIEPAGNAPPTIEVTRPEEAGVWVEHHIETFGVDWIASDPEGDPTIVSLFMDRDTTLGKDTQPIGGYERLDGETGTANVDTAVMEVGVWFIYAGVTDGGAEAGDWGAGPVIVYKKGDVDFDGQVDMEDFKAVVRKFFTRRFPSEWRIIVDMDRDGDVDGIDVSLLAKAATPGHSGR